MQRVQVAAYALTGRRVHPVYVGADVHGHHVDVWDGRDRQGRPMAPGLYLYRMANPAKQTQNSWLVGR